MQIVVRDPVDHLRRFIAERVDRVLQPHDVVYILKTVAREILPTAGLKGRCPQAEMFFDWTVHHELDRAKIAPSALATIAEALTLHGKDGRDNKWLEEQVNDGISFWRLRLELIAACWRFDLPDGMFTTWEAWKRFALPLTMEVSGRPVHLGERGPAKAAREQIEKIGVPADQRPETLRIVNVLGDTHEAGLWWQVTAPVATIQVQVLLGEFRKTDFPIPPGWQPPI